MKACTVGNSHVKITALAYDDRIGYLAGKTVLNITAVGLAYSSHNLVRSKTTIAHITIALFT